MDQISREKHRSRNEDSGEYIRGECGGVIEKEAQRAARKGSGERTLGLNESGQMGRGVQQIIEGSGAWSFSLDDF